MATAKRMTAAEYRRMKADDPFKPVVVKPAPTPKKRASGKTAKKGK